jgi:hypothetical protein
MRSNRNRSHRAHQCLTNVAADKGAADLRSLTRGSYLISLAAELGRLGRDNQREIGCVEPNGAMVRSSRRGWAINWASKESKVMRVISQPATAALPLLLALSAPTVVVAQCVTKPLPVPSLSVSAVPGSNSGLPHAIANDTQ